MGSATMAFNKILVSVLLGSVAGQNTRTFPGFGLSSDVPSTTPVPILRYIDQQNNDGSYTYGYQSGDGSYKIETRLATGEVKGKYGYIDANGNLKETSYGAMADLGFQPIVDGIEYNVQVPVPQNDIATNTIDFSSTNTNNNFVQKAAVVNNNNNAQFANFRPNNNAKIVNGRRAVLRKRLRVRPEDAIRPSDLEQQRQEKEQIEAESREAALRAREEGLRARQEGLRVLEQQRAALRRLQGDLISGAPVRSQASRSFPAFQQQQQRPAPANFQEAPRSDPYVSGIDLSSGSYSYSY